MLLIKVLSQTFHFFRVVCATCWSNRPSCGSPSLDEPMCELLVFKCCIHNISLIMFYWPFAALYAYFFTSSQPYQYELWTRENALENHMNYFGLLRFTRDRDSQLATVRSHTHCILITPNNAYMYPPCT